MLIASSCAVKVLSPIVDQPGSEVVSIQLLSNWWIGFVGLVVRECVPVCTKVRTSHPNSSTKAYLVNSHLPKGRRNKRFTFWGHD